MGRSGTLHRLGGGRTGRGGGRRAPCASSAARPPQTRLAIAAVASGKFDLRLRAPIGRIAAPCLDRVSMRRRVPVRLGIVILVAAALAACSDSTPVAPADATESAAMVQKNCADPHWRDQNLGLWYSVCRQPLRW